MSPAHIRLRVVAAVLLTGCIIVPASAAPNRWTGASGNSWFSNGNWSLGHFPAAGEDAIITNSGPPVLLTNQTAWLASFVLSNRVLVCSNWYTAVRATNVIVGNLGTIALPTAFPTNGMSNRVWVSCVNFTLDAGGQINVRGQGYRSPQGPGRGRGDWHGAGAGHGGRGAGSSSYPNGGGYTYGSITAPETPGSGGGGGVAAPVAGGGVVRIQATGAVTINGLIQAGGSNSVSYGHGGGAGGSVYITCNTFGGTTNGLISVNGGSTDPTWAGGGGGGRIAVSYVSLAASRGVRFSASPGTTWQYLIPNQNSPYGPMMGTLWLPDTQLLTPVIRDRLFTDVRLVIPGFSSWRPGSLTLSNCSFEIEQTNFVLAVTNRLLLDKAGLGLHGNLSTRAGDLVLTNGSQLSVFAAPTNGTGPGYGALVSITGNVFVGISSWIYPFADPTTGGSVLFRMNNLAVQTNGGFNADGRGYGRQLGPGRGGASGGHAPGAGHGGRGSASTDIPFGGPTYGSIATPTVPGSGTYGGGGGTPGGGAVRVEATGIVRIDGLITANGGARGDTIRDGGGSGGSVHITCASFGGSTNGLVRANGGDGAVNYGGGGGGGRIAINYGALLPSRDVRFACAPCTTWAYTNDARDNAAQVAGEGTLWLPNTALLGTNLARQFQRVQLVIPGFTAWSLDRLMVSNCSVTLGQTNFQLTVTNGLTVGRSGSLGVRGSITVRNGNLSVTNGGALHVYSGPTNGTVGAYGARVSVTGTIHVAANSWIYPVSDRTNGGSVLFWATNVTVSTGGGFNANGRGFGSGLGPGSTGTNTSHGPGGGHGGRGGRSSNYALQGQPYGLTNAPIVPGSGGGHSAGGAGGGTVRIKTPGTITLNGTINANGGERTAYNGGGAAGGAVLLACRSFRGTNAAARVSANGTSADAGYSGGGGGGRIVVAVGMSDEDLDFLLAGVQLARMGVYDQQSGFAGSLSATNGTGYENGLPGSKRFIGPYYTLSIRGYPGSYDSPSPDGYGTRGDLPDGTWVTNRVTTPANILNGQRWTCTGWWLTNAAGLAGSGVGTQVVLRMTNDQWLGWYWTNQYELAVSAGPSGTVNSLQVNGWYTNGMVVTNIRATGDSGYQFFMWSGAGVPPGHDLDNPLTVTMNQARTIQANFASTNPVTRRWNGYGPWESATNWTPNGMPASYDPVVIQSGRVRVAYPRYARSLSVSSGATVLFSNWSARLTVSNVNIGAGGVVTLPPAFADGQMSNRVYLVCTNFTLDAGGTILADGRGYTYSSGPGKGGGTWHSAGGGYGGRGGRANNNGAAPGAVYGAAAAPTAPGSGGGAQVAGSGGYGGGAVRIEASRTVNVSGLITANGSNTTHYAYGGGSGGGVYITCQTFGGETTGLIRVNGGNPANSGWYSGGGGGGRIAVQYTTLGDPHCTRLQALGATQGYADSYPDERYPFGAGAGTIWLSTTGLFASVMTNGLFGGGIVEVPGFTSWTVPSLTVSNCSFRLAAPVFTLTVASNLLISGGTVGLGGTGGCSRVTVGRDLVLTNGGVLAIYSGVNTGAGYGARLQVDGDVKIGAASWLYPQSHPTNGGSVYLTARNMTVAAGGGINACARGFQTATGPGKGGGTWHAGGGGHGGKGGHGSTGGAGSGGGSSYGVTNAPTVAGSGGGGVGGGYGGGVIYADVTRSLVLDGTFVANGGQSHAYGYGGGAGGSIFVKCRDFSGGTSGVLRARGNTPDLGGGTYSGGGGGGRIAVWYGIRNFAVVDEILRDPDNPRVRPELTWSNGAPRFRGSVSVAGGIGWNTGIVGTVNFMSVDYRDGMILLCR